MLKQPTAQSAAEPARYPLKRVARLRFVVPFCFLSLVLSVFFSATQVEHGSTVCVSGDAQQTHPDPQPTPLRACKSPNQPHGKKRPAAQAKRHGQRAPQSGGVNRKVHETVRAHVCENGVRCGGE